MNGFTPRQLIGIALAMGPALLVAVWRRDLVLEMALVAAVGGFGAYFSGAEQDMTSMSRLRTALRKVLQGKPFQRPEAEPDIIHAIYDELEEVEQLLSKKKPSLKPPSLSPAATSPSQQDARDLSDESLEALGVGISQLEKAVVEQRGANGDVRTAVAQAQSKLEGLAAHVQTLATSADESSSSVLEMSATTEEVAENIGELASSVREMVASIEEMAFSIREVATNIDELSLTAEETSSSMNQMDVAIDQVQSNADETARLSEEVARDAEHGAESILKTMGEIYRIKESSHEALGVINNLGSRIEAIGEILNVIDDVAEQTNLLALNAAIIAAQAGEHGKGFAVVADEIKDLAERAGASTKEIADLIKTIQSESKNAIAAVEAGAQNVDRGVEVSNEAERALKKILESSQKSTNMVRAIARATVEQAKGSKQVTDAISRIADTVQQIAAATAEQARGSELIMKSGEKMRTISQQVERSSQEQARGSRQIAGAIEAINGMVTQVSQAQREYALGSAEALSRMERVAQLADEQASALAEISKVAARMTNS
jgi:methyl-accepting chemotaxis protein